jgi:hypothetical protein
MDICVTKIVKDCLLFDFNLDEYNLSDDYYEVKSLYVDKKYKKNQILKKYGITHYDIGLSNTLQKIKRIENDYLIFHKKKYNDNSGNTTLIDFGISENGYLINNGDTLLQTCFKYDDITYQLLPTRFKNGFTFQIPIYLFTDTFTNLDDNGGIFLTLGYNSDNKNIPNNKNLANNVLSFLFNKNKKIGVKYINADGLVEEQYSKIELQRFGWNIFTIVYEPNNIIDDDNLLTCNNRRLGSLKI